MTRGRLRHGLVCLALLLVLPGLAGPLMSAPAIREGPGGARLQRARLAGLPGLERDDLAAAFRAFRQFCSARAAGVPATRSGAPAPAGLAAICEAALALPQELAQAQARAFFEQHFTPWHIIPPSGAGFLTGYYEPEVQGALEPSAQFTAPVYGRPADLVTLAPGEAPAGLDPALAAARRMPDGSLAPYETRGQIESGALGARAAPVLWLADPIEAFMIHVQGSARIRLPDGRAVRLAYAGRNGQPYTSIGKILVERGDVPLEELTLARLKQWVRDNGQKPGDRGLALMHENRSFIFFQLDHDSIADGGPRGGAGLPLPPLRALAIDRNLWAYGLPFFIDADLPMQGRENPAQPFARLLIGLDTGSAILGPARGDLFVGSGAQAGRIAGDIRHAARFTVLLPKEAGDER